MVLRKTLTQKTRKTFEKTIEKVPAKLALSGQRAYPHVLVKITSNSRIINLKRIRSEVLLKIPVAKPSENLQENTGGRVCF